MKKLLLKRIFHSDTLSTRRSVKRVDLELREIQRENLNVARVDIDFKDIETISRSFADEITLLKKKYEEMDVQLNFINMSEMIKSMIDLVIKQRNSRKSTHSNLLTEEIIKI